MKLSHLMLRQRALATGPAAAQPRRHAGGRAARGGKVQAASAGSEPRFGFEPEDSYELAAVAAGGSARVAPNEPTLLPLNDVTVLFADVVQSMRLYEALGDRRAAQLIVRLLARARQSIDEHKGELVKTMGDGFMVAHHTASIAVRAAVDLHRTIGELAGELRLPELTLRIGVHRGPVLAHRIGDETDYHGQTVNIASRLQGAGRPNEIIVSEAVINAPGVLEELAAWVIVPDDTRLRGLEQPLRTFRLTHGRNRGIP